tara:strand:+ start:32958 stop:33497 length:540 start_codon:yes stop_codon:yes gene_type:complete
MSDFGWDDTGFAEDPDAPFAQCEDTAVRKVIRKLGNQTAIQSLRHRCKAATGSDLLSFPWFHEEFPEWPIVLGVSRVRNVHKVTVAQILKRFTTTPMFKAYEDFVEDVGVDVREESAGLIFMYPKHTTMVLHNYPRDDELVDKGTEYGRIVRPMGNVTPRVIYTIEPLESLINYIMPDE